jgi:transposase-like protein
MSNTKILQFAKAPATVKELAELNEMSETWVREQLKKANPTITEGKPNKYSEALDFEAFHICPSCGHKGEFEPAGEPGSYLGDSAVICSKCHTTFNVFTGEKIESITTKTTKKRVFLNPQYKIDAKMKAVVGVGGSLVYEKSDKTWVLELPNKDSRLLTPQEFSLLTPETIIK